jgi:hypothetical protein
VTIHRNLCCEYRIRNRALEWYVGPSLSARAVNRELERQCLMDPVFLNLHSQYHLSREKGGLGEDPRPKPSTSPRSIFVLWLTRLGAVLIVAGTIGVALALFGPHDGPPIGPMGAPVTRMAQAGGLRFVMQVTPGPYFLGEMLAANLSLSNHSRTTYTLNGQLHSIDSLCGAAVFVTMSGGSGGPQYELPNLDTPFGFECGLSMAKLAPGQTATVQQFLPVTNTGKVTLQSGSNVTGETPLDGLWPSITLSVAGETPSGRQISLQQERTQVQINTPRAALGHLYSLGSISCTASQRGTTEVEEGQWEPVSGTTLHEPPNCGSWGGNGGQVTQWSYLVTAPGYSIASGQMGSCTTLFCFNTLAPGRPQLPVAFVSVPSACRKIGTRCAAQVLKPPPPRECCATAEEDRGMVLEAHR